jgi:hypothetical protein
MRRQATTGILLALACAAVLGLTGGISPLRAEQRPSTDRAAALQTFNVAVQRYATLRARLEEPLPPFDPSRGAWTLRVQRHYLASAIRNARSRAVIGDIFTSAAATIFRQDITRAIATSDIEGLLEERLDPRLVDLAVNEPIPDWAMRPVPDQLLRFLPLLGPEGIEYRLVADSLILWDAHAEILIDALQGAVSDDD